MDGEYYYKEDRAYDRPTRILDYFTPPELVEWKMRVGKREANRLSKAALKHGGRIDELIRINEEPGPKDSEEVKNCWKAYQKWREHHGQPNLIFPDTVFCEARRVAGTPDIYYPAGRDLIDVKSSRVCHENYFFQLGFYASALPSPYPVERLVVLRLDKTIGDYECITNEQMGLSVADCINGFNGLLLYYRQYKRVQSALKRTGIAQGEEE